MLLDRVFLNNFAGVCMCSRWHECLFVRFGWGRSLQLKVAGNLLPYNVGFWDPLPLLRRGARLGKATVKEGSRADTRTTVPSHTGLLHLEHILQRGYLGWGWGRGGVRVLVGDWSALAGVGASSGGVLGSWCKKCSARGGQGLRKCSSSPQL